MPNPNFQTWGCSINPATGTATAMGPIHYWTIPSDVLRKLVASNDEISQAMQGCFHLSMLSKLVAANHQLGNSGGFVMTEIK